ncbi:MAG: GNAT family N-acetyltransferase [Salinisphaera sp.]|jgi:putative hemolysin|nr:GNAT family N-acetyltransferase [Salinisphaera sp.]
MSVVNPLRQSDRQIGQFTYGFARYESEIEDSLKLRHAVFMQERRSGCADGLECDDFDPFCLHLIVRDVRTDAAVASTRMLTHDAAIAAGGFYSAQKFDLADVLAYPGRFMEIGRTCVDMRYRNGGAETALWAGIAELVRSDDYDHLIGCASVDLASGLAAAHAVCHYALSMRPAPDNRRAVARQPLPPAAVPGHASLRPRLPPLIKAYLRLGAYVCGEPCWDRDFGVADLLMHLDLARLSPRYAHRFLGSPYPLPPQLSRYAGNPSPVRY